MNAIQILKMFRYQPKGINIALFYTLFISVFSPLVVQSIPTTSFIFWISAVPVLIFFTSYIISSSRFRKFFYSKPYLLFFLAYLFLYALALSLTSAEVSVVPLKDFLRGCILFVCAYLTLYFCQNSDFHKNFLSLIFNAVVVLSCFTVLFSVIKYYLIYTDFKLDYFYGVNRADIPWGSSLVRDYNTFALGLLFGIIVSFYYWLKNKSIKKYVFFAALIGCLVAVGLHSGSRRFLILMPTTLFLFLIFCMFLNGYNDKSKFKFNRELVDLRLTVMKCVLSICMCALTSYVLIEFYDLYQIKHYGEARNSLPYTRVLSLVSEESSYGLQSRFSRWQYAIELFSQTSTILVGNFDYRINFGCQFLVCKLEDYPHNAIFSGMLFGGVVGGLLSIIICAYPLLIALKNLIIQPLFFTLFLFVSITTGFVLFSGDSIFSIPSYTISTMIFFAFCDNIPQKEV